MSKKELLEIGTFIRTTNIKYDNAKTMKPNMIRSYYWNITYS